VRLLRKIVTLGLLACQSAVAAGADDMQVRVERHGTTFRVQAAATVAAAPATVWGVLTDYDHLSEFIPGLTSSVTRLRSGDRALVEQRGEARFFFFAFPIDVRLEVSEWPGQSISSRAVGGNLKHMTGRYDIERSGGAVVVRYRGELEPVFALPRFIGALAVRSMAEEQFAAMVAEMERRAAGAR
jgi:carbon monoxide dehydrogenase subunit G